MLNNMKLNIHSIISIYSIVFIHSIVFIQIPILIVNLRRFAIPNLQYTSDSRATSQAYVGICVEPLANMIVHITNGNYASTSCRLG